MTQDDIIQMALEAGYKTVYLADAPTGRSYQFLERFASLVASYEREACAKLCDEQFKKYGCVADKCAAAIRARGKK